MSAQPLVVFEKLTRRFAGRGAGEVIAVHDVRLAVMPGETLGIVGESGCGKSTLGRMAVGLLEPTAGDVLIRGRALYNRAEHQDYAAFRKSLAGVLQMVFQDPQSSLNPRMRVGESVAEPLRCSTAWRAGLEGPAGEAGIRKKTLAMLESVGLDAAAAARYPHEFSGGQRQRVAIARALVTGPAFVVCDEPTSSLDASVQSQVLNLLLDMQQALGLTYCFISHDLAVVRHMSDRVAVMYGGLVVEQGQAGDVLTAPLHPYTRLLLESVPGLDAEKAACRPGGQASGQAVSQASDKTAGEAGGEEPARGAAGPGGCPFAPRCDWAVAECRLVLPPLAASRSGPERLVRCRLVTEEEA